MARKVFISFLGTNNYVETYYERNGKKTTKPVRFIQEVLTDEICEHWTENDKIFVFYTKTKNDNKGSYELNWLDNGQEKAENDIEKIGLEHILKNKPFANIVEGVEIEEGFSEDDVWKIFNVVYGKLRENDEIYFDVTHAFRSIPLFSTILFNFSKFTKNTNLVSVQYGAFEKLGPAYKVKKMPLEQRVAPILDLTNIIKLQDLTETATTLTKYGKIGKVGESIFLKNENNKIQQVFERLKIGIEKLEGFIITNRQKDIQECKDITEVNSQIDKLINTNSIGFAEVEVLKKLKEKISVFSKGNSDENIQAAINWAIEYDMIPQAYTLAQEYIITLVFNKYSSKNFYSNPKEKDIIKNYRLFIGAILGINDKDIKADNYKGVLENNIELTKELLNEELIKALRPNYKIIADNRNILNHAKNSDLSISDFKEQFNSNYYECLKSFHLC